MVDQHGCASKVAIGPLVDARADAHHGRCHQDDAHHPERDDAKTPCTRPIGEPICERVESRGSEQEIHGYEGDIGSLGADR